MRSPSIGFSAAIISIVLLLAPFAAGAQDGTQPPQRRPVLPKPQVDIRAKTKVEAENRFDARKPINEARDRFKVQNIDLRVRTKAELKVATTSGERRGTLKNAREERREIRDGRQTSSTAERTKAQSAIKRHLGLITVRFEVAVRQFDKLRERIASRIEKLKAAGIDTTGAETKLTAAIDATAAAKVDIVAVAALVKSTDTAEDAKARRAEVDAAIKKATASIKAAHAAYAEAARALLPLSTKVKVETEVQTATP